MFCLHGWRMHWSSVISIVLANSCAFLFLHCAGVDMCWCCFPQSLHNSWFASSLAIPNSFYCFECLLQCMASDNWKKPKTKYHFSMYHSPQYSGPTLDIRLLQQSLHQPSIELSRVCTPTWCECCTRLVYYPFPGFAKATHTTAQDLQLRLCSYKVAGQEFQDNANVTLGKVMCPKWFAHRFY